MASLPPGAGVKELSQALTETVEELRSSYRRLESAYEELKKAQEELLKAEQWKTLAYFAGGVAHELGNPLSAVVQYWEWIQNEPDRISPSLLSSIGEELYRMERMITALRYISRPSQIPWEEVDLKEIVVKVLKVFFRSYPDLSVEERVPSVRLVTFPPMLEVVLRNLIGNGIKVQESPRLILLGEIKEDRVVLTIRDFGPGFPPSFSPEPFHSTGEGMGFGIPLSIRLLEVLGGSLLFQNHKEGGEVVITLPFSPSGKRER
jgi:two-component system C4-dicarboxylate transport sensor histidine kinase DctB